MSKIYGESYMHNIPPPNVIHLEINGMIISLSQEHKDFLKMKGFNVAIWNKEQEDEYLTKLKFKEYFNENINDDSHWIKPLKLANLILKMYEDLEFKI